MNKTVKARVFQSGNSQAIRLPKAFRLRSSVVVLEKTPQGILVQEDGENARRARAFAKLAGSCADFPEIEPNTAANLKRDWE
jgi:virulence-associated protein VagC